MLRSDWPCMIVAWVTPGRESAALFTLIAIIDIKRIRYLCWLPWICSSFLTLSNPVLVHGVHESPYEDVQDWSIESSMIGLYTIFAAPGDRIRRPEQPNWKRG